MKGNPSRRVDLDDYLSEEVYPALFERLDLAFPEFAWKRTGANWTATACPSEFPFSVRADRIMVYANRPHWIAVHGGDGLRVLDYANGGRKPLGSEFVSAVRTLASKAGVPFPELSVSPEEAERARKWAARRTALEVVADLAHELLLSDEGEAARAYLAKRSVDEAGIRTLRLGLCPSVARRVDALKKAGVPEDEIRDSQALFSKAEGYLLFPWADAAGSLLTLYGRAVGSPPAGLPKMLGFPGENSKKSPLYLDRARRAALSEVVLVEGLLDAAVLQLRGDARVVATGGGKLDRNQLEALRRSRVRRVFVCGDPDEAGEKGTAETLRDLALAGIEAFAVPRLPEGRDPDEFVLAHGIEAWRALVERSVSGPVFLTDAALGTVSPASPEPERREAVSRAIDFLARPGVHADRLHLEEALALVAERTGFSREALAEEERRLAERRRTEEREAGFRDLLREAHEEIGKGTPSASVSKVLSEGLERLRATVTEAPPAFSVDRLESELRFLKPPLPSGWETLDGERGLGALFYPAELAVVGARPGHAKTAFLANLLVSWLLLTDPEDFFVFYSHEETDISLYDRLLALVSAKNGEGDERWTVREIQTFRRGASFARPRSKDALAALEGAKAVLRSFEGRLQLVHRPEWTVDQLAAHARGLAERRTVRGVLVDYLQLVPPPPGDYGTRTDRMVSATTYALQTLAEDLAAPIVAAAQVNREAIPTNFHANLSGRDWDAAQKEIRKARPQLHHLRDGGAEQGAQLVLGLLNYRADFPADDERPFRDETTPLDIGTLKNRKGEVGRWKALDFTARYGLLTDSEG